MNLETEKICVFFCNIRVQPNSMIMRSDKLTMMYCCTISHCRFLYMFTTKMHHDVHVWNICEQSGKQSKAYLCTQWKQNLCAEETLFTLLHTDISKRNILGHFSSNQTSGISHCFWPVEFYHKDLKARQKEIF